MVVLHILSVAFGVVVVAGTLLSAVKTVVLPRAVSSSITRFAFVVNGRLFDLLAPARMEWARRERILSMYAPLTLLLLPGLWVALVIAGFTFIYWGTYDGGWWLSIETSGSSLLTLGFLRPDDPGHVLLTFVEATLGLGLVGLLISYLPSIYSAFGRRELLVGSLEVRAGTPPSAAELLTRYSRIGWLPAIDEELFPPWETWFMDVEETHTSLPALVFFRSPQPERSWITAAGCILDTAAIVSSTLDRHRSGSAEIMIRTGFFSLRRLADYFGIPYDPDPAPDAPISVTRREFDLLCVELVAAGIPLKADRDQAWRDFAGWRVNYDAVLIALASLVVAPPGRWSTDRGAPRPRPRLLRRVRRNPVRA